MLTVHIALLCAAAIIGYVLLEPSLIFLERHGIVRANYRGETIPTAGGLYLWGLLVVFGLLVRMVDLLQAKLWDGSPKLPGASGFADYMFGLTAVVLLGFIDDMLGDRSVKGFGGHWKQLVQHGVATTGIVKAAGSGIVALWLASGSHTSWPSLTASVLLPPLCANTCNLLDVRPGRALKLFLPAALVMMAVVAPDQSSLYVMPLAVGAALLFPLDIGGKAMLGDAGANMLGFAFGYWLTISIEAAFLWPAIAVLAAFHWFADRRSLTAVIAGNRVLDWWDRLGRNGY